MAEIITGYIYVKSGNTNLAKITVNQEVLEEKYFYWGNGSDSATTTAMTINSGVTTTSVTFTTNYNTTALTTTINGSWVIDATIGSNSVTINCNANDTYLERTTTIIIKKGNTEVATITLTQREKEADKYFYWGDAGSATTTAVTVNSAETSTDITYRTNYGTLTTANTGTWNVTSAVLNSGTLTLSFPVNDTTNERVGNITIKSGSTVVATIIVTQLAKAYFLWSSNSSSSITQTIAAATSATSLSYTTNMSGLVVSSETNYNWVTNKTISNPNGNGTYNISAQTNTTISARTANLLVKSGATEVGKIILTQGAGEPYLNVGKSLALATTSACTITCASSNTPSDGSLFAETVFFETNIITSITQATRFTLSTSPSSMFNSSGTWMNTSNSISRTDPNGVNSRYFINTNCYDNTGGTRTGTVTVMCGSTAYAVITVQQSSGIPDPIYRDVLDSAIGSYTWSLNEERDAVGYLLHQVSYDNGLTWETESQEDVSDDVEWTGIDSSVLQEISFHRFKAVGYGTTNGSSSYGSVSKSHFWKVE